MGNFAIPAVVAVFVGCGLAVLAFVPFVAISYRRRGQMTLWRTASWFAALIYAMSLWTYTLLPLPDPTDVTCAPMQLRPFQFVADIFDYDTSSLSALVSNPAVLQATLNVVLFMPLGWFLRQLAGRGLVVATISGALVSLLIELTQFTGVWGLYSCAYRVFDVDDLMLNTLGAVAGSLIALLVLPLADETLPSSADSRDPETPRPITATRRLIGVACDVLIVWLSSWAVLIIFSAVEMLAGQSPVDEPGFWVRVSAFALPFVAQLVSVLTTGVTLGERIVFITPAGHSLPRPASRLLRFIVGIGGYTVLFSLDLPIAGLLLSILVIVSFVMVFTTRNHRGLACAVAQMDIADARAGRTV
ncbi:VanZ family protein [Brevibacterium sp.]|uniref:VanZ family protein n=1 Tax=Brevibacterium sp. TaxID=1701 RepID=UPI002810D0FB|nr:VanZ family protein [Brevibacterium sp.]